MPPEPNSTAADPVLLSTRYIPVSVDGAAPLTFTNPPAELDFPPNTDIVPPSLVKVPVIVNLEAPVLPELPTCTAPSSVNAPLVNVPPLPPMFTFNWAPEIEVAPLTANVWPEVIFKMFPESIERLAALALARSSVTLPLDVFPIVTALDAPGTPADQFPATLQLPVPPSQLSPVICGITALVRAEDRGISRAPGNTAGLTRRVRIHGL
jgi:hypothetical protein